MSYSRSHNSAHIWDIYKNKSVFKSSHDLLSDHHLCQVAPKLQSRSWHYHTYADMHDSILCSLIVMHKGMYRLKQGRRKGGSSCRTPPPPPPTHTHILSPFPLYKALGKNSKQLEPLFKKLFKTTPPPPLRNVFPRRLLKGRNQNH